ncbi:MAG: hypothetical protein OEY93_05670 [Anaerolineae bacterium]|nr:hypothetical protein [Anaerolineae bacterium]
MLKRKSMQVDQFLKKASGQRMMVFSLLLAGALLAFEIFNFSTTEFAMTDLLGDLQFAGMRWSTILALAFCGIDFAGIARLFTPEDGQRAHTEVWYLFGAWLLAATMNALLTWWGVSIALLQHDSLGNQVIPRESLLTWVPVFVAMMVWLSRILIIGTFSVAGEKIFTGKSNTGSARMPESFQREPAARKPMARKPTAAPVVNSQMARSYRPAPKPRAAAQDSGYDQMPVIARSSTGDRRDYR